MTIEVVTGLPGNAKTLFTIADVKARAEREGRPVFYHGIPELTLDWELLDDPKNWASVPPNSIVVIDEAQKTFRNRSLGSQPPQFVTDLETHRHMGIDIVMITQHPSLIDPAVRRLAGRHRHMVRIWGMEASTVHQWDSVKDNCDKSGARADSQKTKWAFDKKLYGVYKSAEVHTMKRSIPGRVKFMAVMAVLLVVSAVYLMNFIKKRTEASDASSVASVSVPAGDQLGQRGAEKSKGRDPVDQRADAQDYLWRETPRVAGLQSTAPKYDELTKPSRVPVPAACIQIGSVRDQRAIRCKCYSQDGTPMGVEFNMCIKIAQEGVFLDFNPDPDKQAQHSEGRVAGSEAPSTSRPAAQTTPPQNGSQVVSMGAAEPVPTLGAGKKPETIQDGPPNNRATRADFSAMPRG